MHTPSPAAHETSGDRRATLRYPAPGSKAWLGWKDGDVHRTINLDLKDISLGGLSGLTDAEPPAGTPLWVCLNSASTRDWIEVSIVAARRNRALFWFTKRNYSIRMKFTQSCSFEFFKNAIQGFAQDHYADEPAPDDLRWFHGQYWR